MKPIIKWPGGKSREIEKIKALIPTFDRYIEPFLGGGAVFFYLEPKKAEINDISKSLTSFYSMVKDQNTIFKKYLLSYNESFSSMLIFCDKKSNDLVALFNKFKNEIINKDDLSKKVDKLLSEMYDTMSENFKKDLIINKDSFIKIENKNIIDKYKRTVLNIEDNPFTDEDLKENLITGFTSGYYMYFRSVFNDINLNKITDRSEEYRIANFYFVREYCYGSMFRYNSKGEFNIPYGGMSYNRKSFISKIDNMFNENINNVFENTNINCSDFELFLNNLDLTENDFIFLDPPYDTDFSDYEGKDFTKSDQERLAKVLKNISAKFILVIKNTDFIKGLYEDDFNILTFDKQYTYNVRSRNERNTEHLIITNLPV